MALLELETDAKRAGHGSKQASSRARRGGGPSQAPAAKGALGRALARFRQNVWAPIALRVVGIAGGMLALAAIGASSIARGSGVPVAAPSGASTASFLAGGLGAARERPAAAASAESSPPAGATAQAGNSGAVTADAGSAAPSDASAGSPSTGLTAEGKVILNRASAEEMRKLPGVGAKRAQAIVELRTRLGGRFKRITDLLRVKGIGPKGLKKMEAHLVLDAPG